MNAIKEVLHSSKQMVNAFRDYYPPAWSKDANKIIDEAAVELARLQRVVSTAELINAEAQLKNDNESKSLSISNNLLRDLADALKAGE